MNNWKSTLIGSALAGADVIVSSLTIDSFDFSDWKNYLRPVLFAALGYIVADAKKAIKQ